MKKLIVTIVSIFYICNVLGQLPATVSGVLTKKRNEVKLFKVSEGKLTEIANAMPGKGGKFGFLFYPDVEGIFVIGTGNPITANENYKFYFKAGTKLDLTISDFTYTLNGKQNTRENVILTQWHDLIQQIEQKSVNFMNVNSTFADYFPVLEDVARQGATFLNTRTSGNAGFDGLMKNLVKMDLANYATTFLNTPRSAHPALEEYSPYYDTLRAEDFAQNTAMVYAYPWGFRTLSSVVITNLRQRHIKYQPGLDGLKDQLALVPNDTLKGDLVLETAARYKSFSDYQLLKNTFGQYFLTEGQKKQDLAIMNLLAELKPGTAGFNFSFPDPTGKMIKMSDLKGKVILMDVWATWCGPCKAEIPHLKKLEEEMKGRGVVVVSISIDAEKDHDKWLKMIADDNLGGIQLFAGTKSNLSDYYKVTGIPRFMVFDQQGKIIDVDAPRPSQPELKQLLEKAINK